LIDVHWGIQVSDDIHVTIRNCNFIDNSYGLAIIGQETDVNLSYCNAWSNDYNYMLNCIGWGNVWAECLP